MQSNESNLQFSGGCQCGAVRYSFKGPLGTTDVCHCRMCQKAFGSFGAVLVRVNNADFAWTRGEPETFKSSALVDRGFCKNCGTPLFMYEKGDGFIDIAVGTLDNPNAVGSLQAQIGIESRVQWWNTITALPEKTTEDLLTTEELKKYQSLQHPDYNTVVWPNLSTKKEQP